MISYKSQQLLQTFIYSTSSKSSYIEQVYEKDNGQHTTNVNIIACRYILNGLSTGVNIINTVLGLVLTQDDLDALTAIKPVELLITENEC